jgi:Pentapeptide repeats (8 copies)
MNRANLSNAYPTGADLSDANLNRANLSNAYPTGADLSDANLNRANLKRADLTDAHLSGANLILADLSNADLTGAKLTGAALSGAALIEANLTGADLRAANLSGANLIRANLTKTKIANVDLANATYAPASEPPDSHVAGIKGLDTINSAPGQQIGLVQLRKLLQDAGLRDDEQRAIFSIEHSITKDQFSSSFWTLSWLWGILRFVGFELTTAYGLYP